MDKREVNRQIFEDTKRRYLGDRTLYACVSESIRRQEFLLETAKLGVKHLKRKAGNIRVSKMRTLEAASSYDGKKVAILNFASAKNPGGGVENGASAQEESLCRISTLYPCLCCREAFDRFYLPHRKSHNPHGNGDIIYTPDVVVIKTDEAIPALLPSPYKVDVITCSAPNLRDKKLTADEQYTLHYKRGERIIQSALLHEVEVLVLGAFGCGVFENDPKVVAKAYRDLLNMYGACFEEVHFAIHSKKHDMMNYLAFAETFQKTKKEKKEYELEKER